MHVSLQLAFEIYPGFLNLLLVDRFRVVCELRLIFPIHVTVHLFRQRIGMQEVWFWRCIQKLIHAIVYIAIEVACE